MAPKVLFLSYDRVPGPSGAGQQLGPVISELSEQFDIDAVTIKAEEMAHIQRLGQARMMRVPLTGGDGAERSAAFQRAVSRQLESDAYELIYCTDLFSAHTAATHPSSQTTPLVADLFDVPSTVAVERYHFPASATLRQELEQIEAIALTACARVVVHTESMRRYISGRGVPQERLVSLPVAIDTGLFSPPSIVVRDEPHACIVACVVDPFLPSALDHLLSTLTRTAPRMQFRLVGELVDREVVTATAKRHGLERRVLVEPTETPEQLASCFGGADIVLVWWAYDERALSTGMFSIEAYNALSCGRPVVATHAPGTCELIDPARAGRTFRPDELVLLLGSLGELETSSGLRERLGTRGREYVLDRNGLARAVPRLRRILEEVTRDAAQYQIPVTDPLASATQAPGLSPASEDDGIHTPVVPRPEAPPSPPGPSVPEPVVPAPVALGFNEEIETSPSEADPWVHDTVATPAPVETGAPLTPITAPGAIPGIRSVALMDHVGDDQIGDAETEIRVQGPPSKPLRDEKTDRVEVTESFARRLRQQATSRATGDDADSTAPRPRSGPPKDGKR